MSKRSTLLVGLLVAAATAIAASVAMAGAPANSPDGNAQAIDAVIAPKKLSKSTWTPGSLKVTTTLSSSSAANGVPVPTVHVVIDFDKNAKIFTKGIPTCDPAKVQNTSTEIALRECGKAKLGSGKATALIPVGGQVFAAEQTVTAFNGTPKGGKPVILLHSYGTKPSVTTLVLVGTVSNYNREGYGPRLDLEVPKIAGGAGALTNFSVTINKKYRYKGKPATYISAKCPKSRKLKVRSVFTFLDGQSSKPTDVGTCTQKK
jgi:hypothetical protein